MPNHTVRSPSVSKPGSSTVIDLCNQILIDAVDAGASFVHIEPAAKGLVVRYRMGRFLSTIMTVPAKRAAGVRNQYKVMSSTRVGERRRPQGGRFMLRMSGRRVEVQLSTLPTIKGETIVMRMVNPVSQPLELESHGYEVETASVFHYTPDHFNALELEPSPATFGESGAARALTSAQQPSKDRLRGRSVTQPAQTEPNSRELRRATVYRRSAA